MLQLGLNKHVYIITIDVILPMRVKLFHQNTVVIELVINKHGNLQAAEIHVRLVYTKKETSDDAFIHIRFHPVKKSKRKSENRPGTNLMNKETVMWICLICINSFSVGYFLSAENEVFHYMEQRQNIHHSSLRGERFAIFHTSGSPVYRDS